MIDKNYEKTKRLYEKGLKINQNEYKIRIKLILLLLNKLK